LGGDGFKGFCGFRMILIEKEGVNGRRKAYKAKKGEHKCLLEQRMDIEEKERKGLFF
jgi:hypothetical protein